MTRLITMYMGQSTYFHVYYIIDVLIIINKIGTFLIIDAILLKPSVFCQVD